MSTLKYAMTLDGKIATPTGHAAWVSNSQSRQRVFAQRAVADAVIVGGNTVRRDNPRLTTRREGGHRPIRVVMSRTLDLPEACCPPLFTSLCMSVLILYIRPICWCLATAEILMTSSLGDAVQDRNLWDVSIAPTIVMTQQGVRSDMQVCPSCRRLACPVLCTAAIVYTWLPTPADWAPPAASCSACMQKATSAYSCIRSSCIQLLLIQLCFC